MTGNLPNILTVFRLLAAPGVGLVFIAFARPYADWLALFLFVTAALTDFLDGYLARKWGQESRFGAMLDPIADKAMVVISLSVILGLSGLNPLIILPVMVILFREVFVSGLREYLGADAGRLKVTKLAKWKTTLQMIAIPFLFLAGIFQYDYEGLYYTSDPFVLEQILTGEAADTLGLKPLVWRYEMATQAGIILIWIAGALTAVTGWDYFSKAKPYLREGER